MSLDLTPYINSATFGMNAAAITGDAGDAVYAGSVAALVNSITGSTPILQTNPDGKTVTILLTPDQITLMQGWLDSTVKGAIFSDPNAAPDHVTFSLAPVIGPWALKYSLPVIALIGFAGFALGKWVIK